MVQWNLYYCIIAIVILNANNHKIRSFLFLKARTYLDENEDLTSAEKYAKRSLILNLIAVIVTFVVLIGVFIVLQIVFAASGLY